MQWYDLTDLLLKKSGDLSTGTLNGLREFLSGSMQWSGDQLAGLSKSPLAKALKADRGLEDTGRGLLQAAAITADGLSGAAEATDQAFENVRKIIHETDRQIDQVLFEHVGVASVAGASFAGIDISKLKGSFRLNGKDAMAAEIAEDFLNTPESKRTKGAVLCVPGLFCDESLWTETGDPENYEKVIRNENYYPVFVRFNPGNPVPENGKQLMLLLKELLATNAFHKIKFKVVSYSQGGLIFRSMLYQAKEDGFPVSKSIDHALFVNSPDGGSFLEKFGFWMGTALEQVPVALIQIIGAIGNQRSDAMKDLSHGIIRPEDRESGQVERYAREIYFGELDDIMATQVYSVLAEDHELWSRWFGDGIIEEPSLIRLTDKVYRQKKNPENRVHKITGASHFQVMGHPQTMKIFRSILSGSLK